MEEGVSLSAARNHSGQSRRYPLSHYWKLHDELCIEDAGVKPRFNKPIIMGEWVKAKQALQLNPGLTAKKCAESDDGAVEVTGGFQDPQYA
jgi:hypothetical protein